MMNTPSHTQIHAMSRLINHVSKQPRLAKNTFSDIQHDLIIPLNITIDVEVFRSEVRQYHHVFRRWGNDKHDYPRYGAPLVNLTGRVDDSEDPSCWPLDKWFAAHPNEPYWETDFKCPTELLSMSSLDVLAPIKPYMIRSNILLWHREGFFSPHVDMFDDTITHLRLWGVTDDAEGYDLVYGNKKINNYEPGRLYLIDTIKEHRARAMRDNVYTFFIAVDLTIINALPDLLLVHDL